MCLSYSPVQSLMPDSIQVFYPAIQPGVLLLLVQAFSAWEDTKPGLDQALEDWIGLSTCPPEYKYTSTCFFTGSQISVYP